MKKTVLAMVIGVFLFAQGMAVRAAENPAPRVVVSIKPLHSLVAGVMTGIGVPQLLVKGGGSPHGYVLRPSEARMLDQAQLVVWVGPDLETFLVKPLSILGPQARQLELAKALAPQMLPLRQGGAWERHKHGHEEHATHHEPDPADRDPHLWLDPQRARQIVDQTASVLAEIDPVHQRQYRENAAALNQRLDALNDSLQAKLAPVRHIPYVVFHDAYQYFETAYGLNAVGSLTIDPDRRPGARRVAEIRQEIQELKARCVFSEPQFTPRLVVTVIEGTGAKAGVLDPLGADLPAGPECYFQLLRAMADNLVAGLSR